MARHAAVQRLDASQPIELVPFSNLTTTHRVKQDQPDHTVIDMPMRSTPA
jgi:hypothetical protein